MFAVSHSHATKMAIDNRNQPITAILIRLALCHKELICAIPKMNHYQFWLYYAEKPCDKMVPWQMKSANHSHYLMMYTLYHQDLMCQISNGSLFTNGGRWFANMGLMQSADFLTPHQDREFLTKHQDHPGICDLNPLH